MHLSSALAAAFDLKSGAFENAPVTRRHLSDLQGVFADEQAYAAALARGNPLLYSVSSIEAAHGDGQLHCGLGVLMPGKIGSEYYLTKGHYHAWRPAAEIYIGLSGEGMMLLEDEQTHESRSVPLRANSIVYVPGHTAHRTVNTGSVPLTYLGVYPAAAGHDYSAIAARNFGQVVVEQDGQPAVIDRISYLTTLKARS